MIRTVLAQVVCVSALVGLSACSSAPQGTITHTDSARRTAAGVDSGAGAASTSAPRTTVDAIPRDDARRAFDSLPATQGAAKPLAMAARPTPAPAARASTVEPTVDGAVVAAGAHESAAAQTLPEPSIPARREADSPATPHADEGSLLRGETAPAPAAAPAPAPVPPAPPQPIPSPEPITPPASSPQPEPAPSQQPAPAPSPEPAPTEPAPAPAPAEPAPAPPVTPPPTEPAPEPPVSPPPSEPGPPPAPPTPSEPEVFTEPTLHRAALATRVRGLGQLTPVTPGTLHAGSRVIVYFELAGWTPVKREDGQFVTEATFAIQVLDREGKPIWSDIPQRARDISRNERKDLFVTRLITLPSTLAAGEYVIRVVAEDASNSKEASVALPFQAVAAPAK